MSIPIHVVVHPTPGQQPIHPARARVRAQSEAARDAAREAARRVGAPEPALQQDDDGAPLASDGWYWSVAHDASYVAGAVHRAPLGIDLERVALRRPALREAVVSPAEAELLDAREGDLDALAFTRLWTAKEAVLKAAGVGLAELSRCRIVEPPDGERMLLVHRDRPCLVRQTAFGEHVLAVHAPGSGWQVRWCLPDAPA